MGTAYYYFIASLPMLRLGQPPPMSVADFLEDCRRLLSAEDFDEVFKAVEERQEAGARSAFLKEWRRYTTALRNETALRRAVDAHKNPFDYMHGIKTTEPFAVELLASAQKAEDPLIAQRTIDQAQWQHLEELTGGHYFDLEVLIAYALKLKILERYAQITGKTGQETFIRYKDEARALVANSAKTESTGG